MLIIIHMFIYSLYALMHVSYVLIYTLIAIYLYTYKHYPRYIDIFISHTTYINIHILIFHNTCRTHIFNSFFYQCISLMYKTPHIP